MIVYAGAVMVLYVFVVAYVGGLEDPLIEPIPGLRVLAPLFAVRAASSSSRSRSSARASRRSTPQGPTCRSASARPASIGELFLSAFLVAFEVVSLLLLVAAVGAVVLAGRRGADDRDGGGGLDGHRLVPRPLGADLRIGAAGVLMRRSPLVILICLELMLNAGNLALVAFARMTGNEDGQVFALIVMIVAACEVVVGLGLIVAMFRSRLPMDVDEMRSCRG